MKFYKALKTSVFCSFLFLTSSNSFAESFPEEIEKVMNHAKYKHAIWGLYVKDLQSNQVLFNLNATKLFLPASTTKLFSVAAAMQTLGDDYRFRTPVFASKKIEDGKLKGNLILVAQGDLTMGGRQPNANTLEFTKLDHINANEVPGVILTKEDPLFGIKELAKQIYQNGLRELEGDVLIDERLFETTEKRGLTLSPILINENLIDIVITPTNSGEDAKLTWRPEIPGYTIENQVKTGRSDSEISIEIQSDKLGQHIIVKGVVPHKQTEIVRTTPIKDPKAFARIALIEALKNQGVDITLEESKQASLPKSYDGLNQIALWTSPPFSEYAKLILKVSHNLGADLVPLWLAAHSGKKTFDEGMRLLGDFVINDVKVSPTEFVFLDAAGGNDNRLTPHAEVQLLHYMYKQTPERFKKFYDALPIMGVDGSLEDFGKHTHSVGKVRAKTGTGAVFNLATGDLFLTTQALAGYIEGKNGDLFAYMLVVNNGMMPTMNDVFAIFEDETQLSNMIYNHTEVDKITIEEEL